MDDAETIAEAMEEAVALLKADVEDKAGFSFPSYALADLFYVLAAEIIDLKKRVEELENKPKRPSGGYNL